MLNIIMRPKIKTKFIVHKSIYVTAIVLSESFEHWAIWELKDSEIVKKKTPILLPRFLSFDWNPWMEIKRKW